MVDTIQHHPHTRRGLPRRLAAAVAGTTTALALAVGGAAGAVAEPSPAPPHAPYDPVRACVEHSTTSLDYDGPNYLPITVMSVDPIYETIDPSRITVTVHPAAAEDKKTVLPVTFWKEVALPDVRDIVEIVQSDPASEGQGVMTITVDGKAEAVMRLDTTKEGLLAAGHDLGCEYYSSPERAEVEPFFYMGAWKVGSVQETPERFQALPHNGVPAWNVFMTITKQESSRDGDLTGQESVTFDEPGIEILRTEAVGQDGTKYLRWLVVDALEPDEWAAHPVPSEPLPVETWQPGDVPDEPAPGEPICIGEDPECGEEDPEDPQPEDPAEPAPGDESSDEDHTVPDKVETGGAAASGLALAGLGGAAALVALRRRFGMA